MTAIALQKCTSYDQFQTTYEGVLKTLDKRSQRIASIHIVNGITFLNTSAPTLRNRLSAFVAGQARITEAIEAFIKKNACFASQLPSESKEKISDLSIYASSDPAANLQKMLFRRPTIKLETGVAPGLAFPPQYLYIKTSDSEGKFSMTHAPLSLIQKSPDLSKVVGERILLLFLGYYAGLPISIKLSVKELIELHRFVDYLREHQDPLLNLLWRLTLKLIHELPIEHCMEDLFTSIASSERNPSAELIELFSRGLKKIPENKQKIFFNKFLSSLPVLRYFRGFCYEEGIGVPKDEAKALSCYKTATTQYGYTPAWHALARLEKNQEKASEFATFATAEGYKPGLFILANFSSDEQKAKIHSLLISQNYAPLLTGNMSLAAIGAEQNHPQALYALVKGYSINDGAKCLFYFKKALEEEWIPDEETCRLLYLESNLYGDLARKQLGQRLLEKAAEKGQVWAQYVLGLWKIDQKLELEGTRLLIRAANKTHELSIDKLKEKGIIKNNLKKGIPLNGKLESFAKFRKNYNDLVDQLNIPHIVLDLTPGNVEIYSVTLKEVIPAPDEKDLANNKELREQITLYITENKISAAFLPEEEKNKLGKLPLFSEGIPQVIQDIFKEQPSYSFYCLRRATAENWENVIKAIKEKPHQVIHIKIPSEGLEETIITLPEPLLPSPLTNIGSEKEPVDLENTKEGALKAFLDYLYGASSVSTLNLLELTALKTLAELFKVVELAKAVDEVLSGDNSYTIGHACPKNIQNTLSKLRRNPELVNITTQDQTFTAHKALLPAYFHAAAAFKKTAEQPPVSDLSVEIDKDTLEAFLDLQYGLLDINSCSSNTLSCGAL